MSRVERQSGEARVAVVLIGLAAALAVWPTSGRAQDFVWDYSCTPDTGWYQVCGVDTCAGGTETLYRNNWGRTACGTNPTFPGTGDRSVIGADFDATLSAVASVSSLQLDSTATLFVDGVGTDLVVASDIDITGSTAELRIYNGAALTFQGATITNQGVVRLGQSSPPSSYLTCPGPVGLTGAGHLTFAGHAYVTGVGPLTNGAGHTIDGGGADIQAPLVNDGVVSSNAYASVILLSTTPKVNNGTLTASAAGNLDIATQVTQGATGLIAPGDSGAVRLLDGAHVIGGTTTTVGTGLISAFGTSFEVTDITNSGSWKVEGDATMTVSGSTLANYGTVQIGSDAAGTPDMSFASDVAVSGSGTIDLYKGTLTTGAGATVTNHAGHTIRGSNATVTASLENLGLLTSTTAAGPLSVNPLPPGVLNQGTVMVPTASTMNLSSADLFTQTGGETIVDGSLYVNGAALTLAGGELRGNGTVYGSVSNVGGTMKPGNPVQRFYIQSGGYTQGPSGRLLIELGGTAWDTYDRLVVSGAVSLAGDLYITKTSGYTPTAGQSWTIVDASSVTGHFDHVQSWADTDCSLGFTVTYNAGSVVITAVDGTANIFCSNFETGTTAGWFTTVP